MQRRALISFFFFPLAACSAAASDNVVQKFSLEEIHSQPEPILAASPDVTNAVWASLDNASSLRFGKPGEAPLFSLTCEQAQASGPFIHIVRYAPADPGAKALLALLGARMNARLAAETHSQGGAWRWESRTPAIDPQLDVFLDGGAVEATLPGGGTLKLAASAEPARVVNACRHGLTAHVTAEPATPSAPPV